MDLTGLSEIDKYSIIQSKIDAALCKTFVDGEGKNHYAQDGIINPSEYFKDNRSRICFVLKEGHNFNDALGRVTWSSVQSDILFHHEDNDNHYWATNIIRVERFLHTGEHIESPQLPSYILDRDAMSSGNYCTGIGYINIKKYDENLTTTSSDSLDYYVFEKFYNTLSEETDKDIRRKNSKALMLQLDAIAPDYLIACEAIWDKDCQDYYMYLRLQYLLQHGITNNQFKIIKKGAENIYYVIDTGAKKMVVLNWFHACYPRFGYEYPSNMTKWTASDQLRRLEILKKDINELVSQGTLDERFRIP